MTEPRKNIYSNRYGETNSCGIGFLKTMLTWDGSAVKLIWLELMVFLTLYFTLALLYRFVFIHDEYQRELFELLCMYASRFAKLIPVSFMTGFYVANVITRYWNQFLSLAWPDRLAFRLVGFIPGNDEYHRTLRRAVVRYINLSILLVYRLVSTKVEQSFPTYESLVEAGLMMPEEAKLITDIDSRTPYDTTWIPILWIVNLLQKERNSGRLKMEGPVYANLISSFDYLENCNRSILNYAWVNIPLAYTQVATLSVYSYLFSSVFARQFIVPRGSAADLTTFQLLNVTTSDKTSYMDHTPNIYIPIFPILEFICYLGWVKMAEALLNPWGDDDDDFQISYLIDRNFQTTYLIVDEALCDLDLMPDKFSDQPTPIVVKTADEELPKIKTPIIDMENLMKRVCILPIQVTKLGKIRQSSFRKSRSARSISRASNAKDSAKEIRNGGQSSTRINNKQLEKFLSQRTLSTPVFTISNPPTQSEANRYSPSLRIDNLENQN